MAVPRVFISSTCYDLAEVRDTLLEFTMSYGFEPVLSERGDIFYHPDIHTHDSCINEVSNCQLFILIIGGRFGGAYKADTSKSIVNAEYAAAREAKIPVFTFVKRNVHSDHFVFQQNKQNKDITYPSIENKAHASNIFTFIDYVRQSPVNNGYFHFEFAREITDLLRKQWSGMFHDFLVERKNANQMTVATDLLKNISVAGEKVEELVKSLYRHVDVAGAKDQIEIVEKRAEARQFFQEIMQMSEELGKILMLTSYEKLVNAPKKGKWYEYIADATDGTIVVVPAPPTEDPNYNNKVIFIDYKHIGVVVMVAFDDESDESNKINARSKKQQIRFNIIKQMSDKELDEVIRSLNFGAMMVMSAPSATTYIEHDY